MIIGRQSYLNKQKLKINFSNAIVVPPANVANVSKVLIWLYFQAFFKSIFFRLNNYRILFQDKNVNGDL